MSRIRLWTIGSVFVMIVIAAAAWFLGISPVLQAASTAASDHADVDAKNAALSTGLVQLKKDFADSATNQASLDKLRVQVPADGSLDTFLGQLDRQADASGVNITGFTSSAAVPFVPATGTVVTVPASINGSNFVTIPVTVMVTGTRDQIMAFVGELQSGDGRLVLVSDVAVTVADGDSAGATGTITGIVYQLLDTPLVVATPTPVPTATTTP